MVNERLWGLARELFSRATAAGGRHVEFDIAAVPAEALEGVTPMEATSAAAAAASCALRQWDVRNRAMPPYLGLPVVEGFVLVPADATRGLAVHDAPCVCDVWKVDGAVCTLTGSVSIANTGTRLDEEFTRVAAAGVQRVAFNVGAPPAWLDVPFPQSETETAEEDSAADDDGDTDGDDDGGAPDWETPAGHPYAEPGDPGMADDPAIPHAFLWFEGGCPPVPLDTALHAAMGWVFATRKFSKAYAANMGSMNRGVLKALRESLQALRDHEAPGLYRQTMRGFLPAVYMLTLEVLEAHAAATAAMKAPADGAFKMVLFPQAVVTPPKRGPLAIWVAVLHAIVRRLIVNAHAAGKPVMPVVPNAHRGPGTTGVVCHGVKVKHLGTPEERAPWLHKYADPATTATPVAAIRPWTAVPAQYIGDTDLRVYDGKIHTWLFKGAVVTSDVVLLREMAIESTLATVNVIMHMAYTKWQIGTAHARFRAGEPWTLDPELERVDPWRDLRESLADSQRRALRKWARALWFRDNELHAARRAAMRAEVEGLSGGAVVGRVDMSLQQALSVSPPCMLNLVRRATQGRCHLKWNEVLWAQNGMAKLGVPMYGKDGAPGLWDLLGRAHDMEHGGAGAGDPRKAGAVASHNMDKKGEDELARPSQERRSAWCSDATKSGLCPFVLGTFTNGEYRDLPAVNVEATRGWLATALDNWGLPPTPLGWPLVKKRPHGFTAEDDMGNAFLPLRQPPAVLCQSYMLGRSKGEALTGVNARARTLDRVTASVVAAAGVADAIKAAAVPDEPPQAVADEDADVPSGSDSE